jgi:hypothetical protein
MIKGGFENWLDAVRLEIYHNSKHIKHETAVAEINDRAKKLAEVHGIDIVDLEPIR